MSNYNQPKVDVPNKVSFSSVKLGETKQGSPTVGLYLGTDRNGVNHMEKLYNLLGELLQAGEEGCKIGVIVIEGKDYNSGYAYVNPKEARQDNQNQNQGNRGNFSRGNSGGYRRSSAPTKDQARSFLKSKKLSSGNEEAEGN